MSEQEQGELAMEHPSERHLDDCGCAACVRWYRRMNETPEFGNKGRCRVCHEPVDAHPTKTCDRRFD